MSEERPDPPDHRLTRRQTLGIAGAARTAVVLGGGAGKLISHLAEDPDEVTAASAAKSCKLTPEVTEGPFYVALDRIRKDITEGSPGIPLTLRIRVIDVRKCAPIHSAAVDIWHADALGVYSGFGAGAKSRTFMRGIQRTDKSGLARFRSVYPGWYQGRTVHIHVKVHVAGNVVHTGQLYFPDSLTDRVFRRKPYSRRGKRTTRNANDFVFAQGGRRSLLRLRKAGTAYVGSITMGVNR